MDVKKKSRPFSIDAGARMQRGYHAVAIVARQSACKSAKALAGTRFLIADAPVLPLQGCAARECTCRFREYADRRQDQRRSTDVGISASWYVGPERRRGYDRRVPVEGSADSYHDYVRRRMT